MNTRRASVQVIFLFCSLFLISSSLLGLPIIFGSPSVEAAPKRKTPTPTPTTIPTPTPVPNPPPQVPGTWKVVSSPNVGTNPNRLQGVAVVSANDVWAVGSFNGGGDSLIQHWDGTRWRVVSGPLLAEGDYLNAVAPISANDVWAVGRTGNGPYTGTLIEHYDGATWSVVPSSNNGDPSSNELEAVAAISANDVWAVGNYSNASTDWYPRTLIEHWDGSAWSITPSPNVGGASFDYLTAVTAISGNDVWAVGHFLGGSPYNWKTLTLHWDGTTWNIFPSPNIGVLGNFLYGVAAASTNDVWAVGTTNNGADTLVLHWDGIAWSVVPSPSLSCYSDRLNGITVITADDIWAVGTSEQRNWIGEEEEISSQTLVEHWNGTNWSIVPSPNPSNPDPYNGTTNNGLNGIAAVSAEDVWAVGSYTFSDSLNTFGRTLIERYTIP